jgi:hypothetical protein
MMTIDNKTHSVRYGNEQQLWERQGALGRNI